MGRKKESIKMLRRAMKQIKELGKELGTEVTTLEEIDGVAKKYREYKNQSSEFITQIGLLLKKGDEVRLPTHIYETLIEIGYETIRKKENTISKDEKYIFLRAPEWLVGDFRVGSRIRDEDKKNVIILDTSGRYDKITGVPYGNMDLTPLLTEIEEKYSGQIYKTSVTFFKKHTDEVLEVVKKYMKGSP